MSLKLPPEKARRSERTLRMVELAAQGLPHQEIADLFQADRSTVTKHAAKFGLRKHRSPLTPEEKAAVVADYIAGFTWKQLRERHRVQDRQIKMYLDEAGVARNRERFIGIRE